MLLQLILMLSWVLINKRKKFVNPAYKNQTLKWKAIYTSGKGVHTVITNFVKE